jgi:hypothetical protein
MDVTKPLAFSYKSSSVTQYLRLRVLAAASMKTTDSLLGYSTMHSMYQFPRTIIRIRCINKTDVSVIIET